MKPLMTMILTAALSAFTIGTQTQTEAHADVDLSCYLQSRRGGEKEREREREREREGETADGKHPLLISVSAYLGSADIVDRPEAPCAGDGINAEEVAQRILHASKPLVAELQRPCKEVDRFLKVMNSSGKPPHPYVLVLIDGDPPFEVETQTEFRKLPNLQAVYATNLQKAMDSGFFFPLPQGMCYHFPSGNYEEHILKVQPQLKSSRRSTFQPLLMQDAGSRSGLISDTYQKIYASSKPWALREKKLLIAPMGRTSDIRDQYKARLKEPEFADMVEFWEETERVPIEQFLSKIAEYQFLLSPPGVGYDCFRHWEALAVGTVPMVLADPTMDLRVFDDTGANFIPPPDKLTSSSLAAALANGRDPSMHAKTLHADYWEKQWRKHLPAQTQES
eukprot:TRINITY_DN15649_c0_g1_i1.p1 TRINITY_DN15649_c0_g1~~TRINITY_DN15649_c0_g1_i1.p1  ORF type:complete len:393 (-),score=68.50 TRINITY_DN15649_c0_g1_i1:207-1385(-)